MEHSEKIYFRLRVAKLLPELKKRQYDPYFFETAGEAKEFILGLINPGETVGVGGSVTLRQNLNIVEDLRKKGNLVYDPWEAEDGSPRQLELKRAHRSVDVFLSSTNTMTYDGIMVNIDGGGNRVASICSGPKRVIIVAGVNKLMDSLDEAIDRTQNQTSVLRAISRKHPLKPPCVSTGICSDCASPQRICAALLILQKKPMDIDYFAVVLVNEKISY